MRAPAPLRPGSTVAIVAPASPFDREELFRGLAWLETRYRLRARGSLFARDGYLAGDDARRAEELEWALRDPSLDAIICARGGYGVTRILDRIPWDAVSPKWLVGFSDITALHLELQARNICSIHGPNVTGLGRKIGASERLSLIHALEGGPAGTFDELARVTPGDADGVLVGGNLALVEAMAAAGRLRIPEGAILVLEEVTERPYRVDRMLASLRLAGVFARASAVVFGSFTHCDAGPDGVTVRDVIERLARDVKKPIAMNAPFGHGQPNHAFVLGRPAQLRGTTLRL